MGIIIKTIIFGALRKLQVIFLFFVSFSMVSQSGLELRINDVSSQQELLDVLLGNSQNIEVSNLSVRGGLDQTGTFSNPLGNLGIRSGIVLASGIAKRMEGPNGGGDDGNISTSSSSTQVVTDPELDRLALEGGAGSYEDAVVIEFDFVPKGNKLQFTYVMASEEYIEDDEDFPDMFGFWISGPGYAQPTNIARIPNTNTVVTTGTVNDRINSTYFNSNGSGNTPGTNFFFAYDGFTDAFLAEADVIPCQTYRIKLAIADSQDKAKDSGVFIEQGSFNSVSEPILTVAYESPLDTAFEGCAGFELRATNSIGFTQDVVYQLTYSGSATALDFGSLPTGIRVPANQNMGSLDLVPLLDALQEGTEELVVKLIPACDTTFVIDSLVIPIKDGLARPIDDFEFCAPDTVPLTGFDAFFDRLIFEDTPFLSCLDCNAPEVYLLEPSQIHYTYTERVSGCSYTDSFLITQFVPILDFELTNQSDFYTRLDLVGTVTRTNLTDLLWVFPDQTIPGPTSVYQVAASNQGEVCVLVELIGRLDSLNCQSKADTVFCISDTVFVPNVFTPNLDGKNDAFVPKGFVSGFWQLEMYNRYGKLVFKDENYELDYRAADLSEGVYYYQLTNRNQDRVFKGWVQVLR